MFDPRTLVAAPDLFGAGSVWGHQLVMLAALIGGSLGLWPDTLAATRAGLHGMRALHRDGFACVGEPGRQRLCFPVREAVAAMGEESPELAVVELDDRQRATSSILMETMGAGQLEETARRVARLGPSGLTGMPVETVGAWSSVDRAEIESMRSMRNILAEYVQQELAAGAATAADGRLRAARRRQDVRRQADGHRALPGRIARLEYDLSQCAGEERCARRSTRSATSRCEGTSRSSSGTSSTRRSTASRWAGCGTSSRRCGGAFVEGEAFHPLGRRSSSSPAAPRPRSRTSPTATTASPGTPRSPTSSAACAAPSTCRAQPAGPADAAVILRRALLLHALLRQSRPFLFAGGRLNIDEGVLRAFLDAAQFQPRSALDGGDRADEHAGR